MPAAAPAIGITKNSTFGKRFKVEEFRIHTEMQPLIWLRLIHGTPPLQKSANFRHKYLAIFLSKDSIPHGLIIMPPIQRRFLYSITVIKLQLFIEPPFYYYCVLWPFWAVYRFVFDNFLFVPSFRAGGFLSLRSSRFPACVGVLAQKSVQKALTRAFWGCQNRQNKL